MEELRRILGERPFVSNELRNIDRFRGAAAAALLPAGAAVWDWIKAFRGPGPALQLAGVGGADSADDESDDDEDDDDEDGGDGSGGGGGGGGGEWLGRVSGRKYPVAT